ncbi:MAG TPA: YncE family protein [Terriglobia bacterium]|nr:YncE family protein [Terriglobia bacterium]
MVEKIYGFVLVTLLLASAAAGQQPLKLAQIISMPEVRGRIDHFDVDLRGQRLFMSALGNNTLEVFDLRTGKHIHTIRDLGEPQGVTYAPRSNRIVVANAGDGTCRIFDGRTYRLLRVIHFPSDADDTRYGASDGHVYIGYGNGGIGILDARTGRLIGTIRLPGHPESFQLASAGPLIYVNVPTAGHIIIVLNRDARKLAAKWTIEGARGNFPMAVDNADHRLFVVCRQPAEMLVLDTSSGRTVARSPCVGDADDMWYDAGRKRIYISGGEGFISVVEQRDRDHYRRVADIRTAPGARTSCFVPQLSRFYLAVPRRGSQSAELRIYDVEPSARL